MTAVLPVVVREIRAAARRPWLHLSRSLGAGISLLFISFILLIGRLTGGVATAGQELFGVLSFLNLALGILFGIALSCDAITSERREGTLGLLFLTPLRAIDVALGKLSATSLFGAQALLGALPLMGLCVLVGGVTLGEYLRTSLVVAMAFLVSLEIGLLASTLSQTGRLAGGMSALGALIWVLAPYVTEYSLAPGLTRIGWMRAAEGCKAATLWHPAVFGGLAAAADVAYRVSPADYCRAVGALAFDAVIVGTAACLALGRLWRDAPEAGGRDRQRRPWAVRRLAGTDARRLRILDAAPFAWPTLRRRGAVLINVIAIVAPAGLVAWIAAGSGALTVLTSVAWVGCRLGGWVLFLIIAFDSARPFLEARRSGAFEWLLATPLSERDYERGWRVAIIRTLWPAGLALASLEIVTAVAVHATGNTVQSGGIILAAGGPGLDSYWGLFLALTLLDQALSAAAFAHASLWFAVCSRTARPGLSAFVAVVVCQVAMSMVVQALFLSMIFRRVTVSSGARIGLWMPVVGVVAPLAVAAIWVPVGRQALGVSFRRFAVRTLQRGPGVPSRLTRPTPPPSR